MFHVYIFFTEHTSWAETIATEELGHRGYVPIEIGAIRKAFAPALLRRSPMLRFRGGFGRASSASSEHSWESGMSVRIWHRISSCRLRMSERFRNKEVVSVVFPEADLIKVK